MTRSARFGLWALGVLTVAGAGSLAWRAQACAGFGGSAAPVVKRIEGKGHLFVGGGIALFDLPATAVPAGYGPPRHEAKAAGVPLFARALVFRSEPVKVALVSLDLLLVPERLAAKIRERAEKRGLSGVLVVATHAHSSVGGFDPRLVPEVAALGHYRPEIEQAIVEAADRAMGDALGNMGSAEFTLGRANISKLVHSRDAGEPVDTRLVRIGISRVGEIVLLSAHPTLVARNPPALSGDYPEKVALSAEAKYKLLTLVLQSAVGNASTTVPSGRGDQVQRFSAALDQSLDSALADVVMTFESLSFVEVTVPLPRPDSRRLVPLPLRAAGDALLCETAPSTVTVTAMSMGPITLVGVPGEPTAEVAQALEDAASDPRLAKLGVPARVVALAGGYLGYLETPEHVRAGTGESKRQYFGPELYDALVRAAGATRQ